MSHSRSLYLSLLLLVSGPGFAATGTLWCDGAVRGTAALVDISAYAPTARYQVISTAAHVLYNPHTQQPWQHCFFQLGNDRFRRLALGEQLQGEAFGNAASVTQQAEHDWAFVKLAGRFQQVKPLLLATWSGSAVPSQTRAYEQVSDRLANEKGCQLAGFSQLQMPMLVSHRCNVGRGGSGAPLIVQSGGVEQLVAIHGGDLIINGEVFEQARAVDQHMLQALSDFVAAPVPSRRESQEI